MQVQKIYIFLRAFVDVNECQTSNQGGCAQVCTNTLGTYTCGCNEGYMLNIDGRFCDGRNFSNLDTDLVALLPQPLASVVPSQ